MVSNTDVPGFTDVGSRVIDTCDTLLTPEAILIQGSRLASAGICLADMLVGLISASNATDGSDGSSVGADH